MPSKMARGGSWSKLSRKAKVRRSAGAWAASLVDDGGAGLPEGAVAYADFKNGTYHYGGNTLEDLFVENLDWGAFDPDGKIVPGVGYVGTAAADGPTLASALAAQFLASGYTLVANIAEIGDSGNFGSDFVDLSDYDPDVSFVVGANGIVTVNSGAMTDVHSFPIRLAATLEPARVACSVNGEDSIEDTFSHTGFTHVVLSFVSATVEDVTFYPPKSNAEIQALSA
jgi:hypothetical protein